MMFMKYALAVIVTVGSATQALAQDAPSAGESDAEEASSGLGAPAVPDSSRAPAGEEVTPEQGGALLAPTVAHRPVHQLSGGPVELHFRVGHPERLGQLIVRWRPMDAPDAAPREQVVERTSSSLVAVLEGAATQFPGIVYWVVHRDRAGREHPVFASAADPHPASARETAEAHYERVAMARRGGRRSRAILAGEYVSLGAREVRTPTGGTQVYSEQYYQVEASFSYAFFQTVDTIRLTLGRMRGNMVTSEGPSADERGIDYGSAEITLRAHDLFHVRASVLFGFSQAGFEYGGGVAGILGQLEGTSLTLGFEGVTTLGITGFARLGWLTVPRVPMGATIEVTTFPVEERAGVRLLYDIGYEVYPGAYVKVEAGYRGWSSIAGGLSVGAEVALSM